MSIKIDEVRDCLLSDFGKAILRDRYLFSGENYQDLFVRVSSYYSDNPEHAQRLYDYISQMWFMPATPILSNGGTKRGMPISCFLNECEDSMDSIADMWRENASLASCGGGVGSYMGNVRSINESIKNKGMSSGIIPFINVINSMTLAVSQGGIRRGSTAVYLQDSHPEIEEFIDIRRPTGGDNNRRCLNIHHGVVLTDKFMEAVGEGKDWDLISPATGKVIKTVSARELWIKMLTARVEMGEPYLLFIDNVNKAIPEHHKKLGLQVKMSNLCSEICLPTGKDHLDKIRTAVCCLSSLNLEYYDVWEKNPDFIPDVMRFLDNVLEDFIHKAPDTMKNAKYSARRERSVGLGVMGFHSFLQKKMVSFEGVVAKTWNIRMSKHIKEQVDRISVELAHEKGACPDAEDIGIMERFSNKLAIAPTANISIITNNTSPGIEPYAANSYTQKTLTGSFNVRNRHLWNLLKSKGQDNDAIWSSITVHDGSVQHLNFLTDEEKLVFKTAMEIDQGWIVEHAADRTPYICQAQSLNVFVPADINKKSLHELHYNGWKKGVKSFYYCRSRSIQRADKVSMSVGEECLSCQ